MTRSYAGLDRLENVDDPHCRVVRRSLCQNLDAGLRFSLVKFIDEVASIVAELMRMARLKGVARNGRYADLSTIRQPSGEQEMSHA